ncbi:MAG: hypothetical protein B6U72_00775 [Candidatus Altiarchaeales archaeon ex4484_2]|nr:MAG: hypothetical protein B6U72_00775 [Candidatus Altiarchaeales archaeon ex4484_2]
MCSVIDDCPIRLEFRTRENTGAGVGNPLTTRMIIRGDGNIYMGNPTDEVPPGKVPPTSLIIDDGVLCVDDGGDNCDNAVRTQGSIYAEHTAVTEMDLAENYPTKDTTLEPGDLVALDLKNPVFVQKAQKNLPLIGVVSANPGILLGGFADEEFSNETRVLVSLAGRVLVKVSPENGPIAVGDRIMLSSTPGVGMKATGESPTVGLALQPYNKEGFGEILVFINLR